MGDYIDCIEREQAVSNRDLATCLSRGLPISLNGEVEGNFTFSLLKSVRWDTVEMGYCEGGIQLRWDTVKVGYS